MLARGAIRRCPWCAGRGAYFTGWFAKQESCRSCGLRWRRGDVGFELGAAATTAIITLGPLVIVLGIMVAATWPEVATLPMFVVLGSLAVGLPIATYGSSYLMWQGLDIVMRPPTPDDFDLVADPLP
jgi:uncharacterized protein (DUF983 family)